MEINEMIEVLQAYKEGKEIEVFDDSEDKWFVNPNPLWNFANGKYRIKKNPTNLEVANKLWEETFGIANRFSTKSCPADSCANCPRKGLSWCDLKSWWDEEYKGGAEE